MAAIRLGKIAYARSGDKGAGANVGVIARSARAFEFLREQLTAARVEAFFAPMNPGPVVRYELPNLLALNFVLPEILDGGGSVSLRSDAQGKALGQAILEMSLDIPEAVMDSMRDNPPADAGRKVRGPDFGGSSLRSASNDPAILELILNRPEKRNALDLELIEHLCHAVLTAKDDPGRRVILIRAEGPAFCAGLDLHEASRNGGPEQAAAALSRLYAAMVSTPLITIAAAQGTAIGGGVGLLAACDLVVASEELQISLSEVRRGLVPALVCCLLHRQLSDRSLREMILLGESIDASQALKLGLINRVLPAERLRSSSHELAQMACRGAPLAIAQTKRLLNEISGKLITRELARVLEYHRNPGNSSEALEGMAAFIEKRAPRWAPPIPGDKRGLKDLMDRRGV